MDHTYQLFTIGNSTIGKTCLLNRFFENTFSSETLATIGICVHQKEIEVEGEKIKLTIQDTSGQERYRSVCANFYSRTDGIIICFSIVDKQSFDHLDAWIDQIRLNASPDICLILAGCKEDLKEERTVTYDEALGYAEKNKMCYIETSSKTGYNVKELFEMISWAIKDKGVADKKPIKKSVVLNKNTHVVKTTKESDCSC